MCTHTTWWKLQNNILTVHNSRQWRFIDVNIISKTVLNEWVSVCVRFCTSTFGCDSAKIIQIHRDLTELQPNIYVSHTKCSFFLLFLCSATVRVRTYLRCCHCGQFYYGCTQHLRLKPYKNYTSISAVAERPCDCCVGKNWPKVEKDILRTL